MPKKLVGIHIKCSCGMEHDISGYNLTSLSRLRESSINDPGVGGFLHVKLRWRDKWGTGDFFIPGWDLI